MLKVVLVLMGVVLGQAVWASGAKVPMAETQMTVLSQDGVKLEGVEISRTVWEWKMAHLFGGWGPSTEAYPEIRAQDTFTTDANGFGKSSPLIVHFDDPTQIEIQIEPESFSVVNAACGDKMDYSNDIDARYNDFIQVGVDFSNDSPGGRDCFVDLRGQTATASSSYTCRLRYTAAEYQKRIDTAIARCNALPAKPQGSSK